MSESNEEFDGLLMTVIQKARGIDNYFDAVFGFLFRKTDFFTNAEKSHEIIEVQFKKYLNKTNLSNVSNMCPKKSTNPKYNIFNLYSKKRNDKFYNNDSNNPKSERTLFEKLEYNLLKLSKKTKKNSKKNSRTKRKRTSSIK